MLARHAGIDPDTGQLTPAEDGGPRRLVISSDFYTVYAMIDSHGLDHC